MPDVPCPVCGSTIPPRLTQPGRPRIYCSDKCGKKANADSHSKICDETNCDRPVRAKGLCLKHYKASHPNAKSWKKNGNPEVRRAALRKKTQQRRAKTRDPDAELIDRDEIGARDGWRCGLCAKRIRPTLAYPDPRSPSLDHIVPLAHGGRHTKTNVHIAHLKCNLEKGARGGGEQLLLVG